MLQARVPERAQPVHDVVRRPPEEVVAQHLFRHGGRGGEALLTRELRGHVVDEPPAAGGRIDACGGVLLVGCGQRDETHERRVDEPLRDVAVLVDHDPDEHARRDVLAVSAGVVGRRSQVTEEPSVLVRLEDHRHPSVGEPARGTQHAWPVRGHPDLGRGVAVGFHAEDRLVQRPEVTVEVDGLARRPQQPDDLERLDEA